MLGLLHVGTLPSVDELHIDRTRLTSVHQVRMATEASIWYWDCSMNEH